MLVTCQNQIDAREPIGAIGGDEDSVQWHHHDHVGAREVLPFEQQRLVEDSGKGVGEAISKAQRGRVSPFAVAAECLPCGNGLGLIRVK